MTRVQTLLATTVAASVVATTALAQTTTPITNTDVLGRWDLMITPAEREDATVSVEMDQGDLPLTITGQASGALTCVLRDTPAPCRIQNGTLSITMPTRSGGGRMIFTINSRTRTGFGGTARFSVRFLPINGHVGSVAMTRR